MRTLPVLLLDGYKLGHPRQYPEGTEMIYSNLTPRGTRREGYSDGVILFGPQYFIKRYLLDAFQRDFFDRAVDDVVKEYRRRCDAYLGPGAVETDRIAALHDLGYLPLEIRCLPEGTLVPYGVPALTINNTLPEFFWLTNMLETLMSAVLWKPCTTATTARQFWLRFQEYAKKTGADPEFVPFQGHDFSMRGMSGPEDAALSGAAHLLYFVGTDTVPALDLLEQYYEIDATRELLGVSVPATEHSVMCAGGMEDERGTFDRLVSKVYPSGIVSIVSDTWDFWGVLTHILPSIRDEIMVRDGKVVIRPDSGDPVKIICGDFDAQWGSPEYWGAIQLLWDTFGGTQTPTGYRVLDPHVGLIYGDSINLDRQARILGGLAHKGFASSNVVLGLGSYTYQFVTRDTDGWAMKATAARINGEDIAIFKDPKTDSGLKRSARGFLKVKRGPDGRPTLLQDQTWDDREGGMLELVFINGTHITESFQAIRVRAQSAGAS